MQYAFEKRNALFFNKNNPGKTLSNPTVFDVIMQFFIAKFSSYFVGSNGVKIHHRLSGILDDMWSFLFEKRFKMTQRHRVHQIFSFLEFLVIFCVYHIKIW